jgi:hypothetical protein
MYYWYFTYFLDLPSSGSQRKDDAVASSVESLFPIGNVQTYFKEEFGDDARITILNVLAISEMDYLKCAETMGLTDD